MVGIGVLKGVQVAIFSMRCIDGKWETFTLEGKIVIFKTIAISKIVFQPIKTTVPNMLWTNLKKYKKLSIE